MENKSNELGGLTPFFKRGLMVALFIFSYCAGGYIGAQSVGHFLYFDEGVGLMALIGHGISLVLLCLCWFYLNKRPWFAFLIGLVGPWLLFVYCLYSE
jgi:hypothetical protein